MKKIIFTYVGLFIITLNASFGQTQNIDNYFRSLDVVSEKGSIPDDVIGTSYINANFMPAKTSTDDKTYAVRYNAYRDEMEIQYDKETYYLTKALGFTVTFITDNKIYKAFPLAENASQNGFYVVLSEGKNANLLLREEIKYIEGSGSTTGYDTAQPPQFKRQKDIFYISVNGTSTRELPSKKKDFLPLFGSFSKQVDTFMKKEKLNTKKTEDLSAIFNYYNSL